MCQQSSRNTKMIEASHHAQEHVASRRHETPCSVFDAWISTSLHGEHNACAKWSRLMMLNLPAEEAKMSNSGTTSSDLAFSDTSKRTMFETNDIEEAKMPDPTRRSQCLPLAAETSSETFTPPDNTTLATRLQMSTLSFTMSWKNGS